MTGLILLIFRYSRIWLDLSPLPLKLNNCETISLPDFVVNNSVSRIGASYSSNPFGFSKFDEDKIAYKAILDKNHKILAMSEIDTCSSNQDEYDTYTNKNISTH